MENTTKSAGVDTAGLLGISFIVLKLTGVINWSWLWVLSPFWIPVVIVITVLASFGLVAGGVMLTVFLKGLYENHKNRS